MKKATIMGLWTLVLLAFFYFSSRVGHTEEMFLGYGLGVFHSAEAGPTEVKVMNLGLRLPIWKGLFWQVKGGYWNDASGDPGRSSSAYFSAGPAVEVNLAPFIMRTAYGFATITSPDNYLGGMFPQLNGELFLGFRDQKGTGLGVEYEHISSAGFLTPNLGRDFLILQMSQRF